MDDEDMEEFDYDEESEPYAWQWSIVPVLAFEFAENIALAFATVFDGLKAGSRAAFVRRLNFADALDEIEQMPVTFNNDPR